MIKSRTLSWILSGFLVVCTLAGCSVDRWAGVEAGEYIVARAPAAGQAIRGLEIDRDTHVAVFTLADGSEIIASFAPRDRTEWPSGCPANIGSTRMEVLDIEGESLDIGAVTFSDPILVRDCPPDPVQVILRSDGAIGGAGGACAHPNGCIFFRSGATPAPLPRSMKGYELYGWYAQQEGEWYYTLITATNRLKTWEEITSQEDVVTAEGWVKITVQGVRELEAVLERLPADTSVTWRGPQALERSGTQPGDLALPPESVIDEVKAYCEETGVQLQIAY